MVCPSRSIMWFLSNLSCTWLCSCPFILLVTLVRLMNSAHTSGSLSAQLPCAEICPVASLRMMSHSASTSMFTIYFLVQLLVSSVRSACPLTRSQLISEFWHQFPCKKSTVGTRSLSLLSLWNMLCMTVLFAAMIARCYHTQT
jgi:hypothetical protein